MRQTYAQELRSDTSKIIVPILTAVTVLGGLLGILITFDQQQAGWHFVWIIFMALGGGFVTWRLIQTDRVKTGVIVFIGLYLAFITLLLAVHWQPGTPLLYLFGIFILISSMLHSPRAGFYTWLLSVFLAVAGVTIHQGTFDLGLLLRQLTAPTVINFLFAIVAFLTAVEWNASVESISGLHRRAQRRRDELFAAKTELDLMNARLRSANQQLDIARQEALTERDLRTRFMNNVSHELRTPLNSIVNFANILAHGWQGPVTPEQADYLDRIEKSGWHLLAVLNDLLDMAQIEAGEFKLHKEQTSLQEICEEAMAGIRGLILEKPIQLIRDYPPEWPTLYADKIRLKQALINLLGNAEKYTEEGFIALRVKPEENTVRIVVEDSGIGIAPEHYEIIFQEFHQVNEKAARRRVGTGLGLPIARHLVAQHGGTITVRSKVGQGTAFTISLPIVTAPLPDQEQKELSEASLQAASAALEG